METPNCNCAKPATVFTAITTEEGFIPPERRWWHGCNICGFVKSIDHPTVEEVESATKL